MQEQQVACIAQIQQMMSMGEPPNEATDPNDITKQKELVLFYKLKC